MLKTVIPLNNIVLFPNMIVTFDVTNQIYIDILEKAQKKGEDVFVTLIKSTENDISLNEKLCFVGVICTLIKVIKVSDNVSRVYAQTGKKATASSFEEKSDKIIADIKTARKEKIEESMELTALFSSVKDHFITYAGLIGYNYAELLKEIRQSDDMERVSNIICHGMTINPQEKQALLEEKSVSRKLYKILEILIREMNYISTKNEVLKKVRSNLDENQRKYFLREQIKVAEEELGLTTSLLDEISSYQEKIDSKDLKPEVKEKLEIELQRLNRAQGNGQESSVIRDYLDRVLSLPWNKNEKTDEIDDISNARNILEEDHFGLVKVKERVVEFLAVRSYSKNAISPILCLVGPPGVGKTSIAKSIAKATGRKYIRIALGGVRDESDIRGHRRTYIGAMPGRIITGFSKVKVNNPLILLDEIDKMGKDMKGDPTSALLEVLDQEQNSKFTDHYVAMEFDISNAMFICTANNLQNIPEPLKDRLEIINLSSYTVEEKVNIAKKFLLKKELVRHNLNKSMVKIKDEVYYDIIKSYTKEAGVRHLDQLIATILRKIVTKIIEEDLKTITVTSKNITDFLGTRKFLDDKRNETSEIGIVRGLAYTSVGGVTLSIESVCVNGTGKFEFTGNLGKIMQESARASMSYIRNNSENFSLSDNFYKEYDIHIHVPAGSTPKDGPSAGTAITTSIVSSLTGKYVKSDVAMTGEVTITGRVLPIGGLKEKLLAAKNASIRKVYIPELNKSDYNDLEKYVKDGLEVKFVSHMKEILDEVLMTKEEALIYECK